MKLTPIKVKGKAGPRKTWKPPTDRTRKAKRRRDEEDEKEGGDDGGDRPPRRRFKARKPAEPIEELPTEILERIIFMSRNLNFLRSSLRIGYRFSSRSFLTELLEAAFAPTLDLWFGYKKGQVAPPDRRRKGEGWGNYRWLLPECVPGEPDFQSAVLACKWVNTTLILEAQQKWFRRNGLGRLIEYLKPSKTPVAGPGLDGHPDVAARFEAEWETLRASCAAWFPAENPPDEEARLPIWQPPCYVEVHPLTRAPERLLTGPFDWETARTLFWLVRGGAHQLRQSPLSWEATKRGYDNIMALGDKQLAFLLLTLWVELRAFEHWPEFLRHQGLEAAAHQLEHCDSPTDWKLWKWAYYFIDRYCWVRAEDKKWP
ncbi:uncharacterized protein P884DRAFT_49776 [Thermothelomyces heterothallicus CBS 202.75]|uniref:uncharacterized protein n=1 Tax=Thermothelomyces heterothallicus CBS 202.75 TaxID=1149848 RepID=UPI003743D31E